MKNMITIALLSLGMMLVVTQTALAMDYEGTIVAVKKDLVKVNYGQNKPRYITGQVSERTAITISGKPATVNDLQQGQFVSISIQNGQATSIDVKN